MTTGIISTVAGSGPTGVGYGTSTGDGSLATAATFDRPIGVAFNSYGDMIIVESASERWRIVNANTGIVTAFAGTGTEGYGGDGGPAVAALLAAPTGIAIDGADNAFMADQLNCRVRRIDSETGIINTISGDGTCQASGDGGPADLAMFNRPAILAMDSFGDLFICSFTSAVDGQNIRVIYNAGMPSDSDGDGFSYDEDCNDNDPTINPDACDIRKDGIDQDCDGVDRLKGKPCYPDDGGEDPPANVEGPGQTCKDELGNDGDDLVDCDDPDCAKRCKL